MKTFLLTSIILLYSISCHSQSDAAKNYAYRIPAGENSWISHNQHEDRRIIRKEGIRNWNGNKPLKIYFRTNQAGIINLGLNLKSVSGVAKIKLSLAGKSHEINLENTDFQDIYVGSFSIEKEGYQQVTIEIADNQKNKNIAINELLLSGSATQGEVNFVKNNFHFGRRGPSVHLRYPIPEESEKPIYFYNEIVVPAGEDVIGSYFMANGFAHGYFGIQVNSETERRILFSVWSPYDTQVPSEIPEDQKIVLLKKGADVYTEEFGNEGSGGQSFKRFMWKADTTYRLLLKGKPSGSNHTNYSAYFYAPEKGKWELIASFKRPKAGNYLGNLYSFLENFVPATGDITREAHYKNQWIYDQEKGWIALQNAIFTADATANQKDRLDYAGGEIKGGYFLKNCGFFDNYTPTNTKFSHKSTNLAPEINFEELP